ncbi:MAG: hypothetical protein AAF790_08190 [Planctomycetota bacterium]
MKAEELIEVLAERPFHPLRLHMSGGRTHAVRHPETAIVGEQVVALGVASEDSPRPRIRMVSIAHINEIDTIEAAGGGVERE